MSKLQSYVVKEVFRAFIPAFLALLFIMVLGFCVQLLHQGLDVVRLRGMPQHVTAFSIPWVLPPAFLTAVIMAFGRLTAENELNAMRVGGVRLLHVIVPVLGFSLLLSVVALYFQFYTVPSARRKIELLKFQAVKQILLDNVALSAHRQLSFRPCTIQYEDFRDGKMINVLVIETEGGVPRTITAAEDGVIMLDPERPQFIRMNLRDCRVTQLAGYELGRPSTMDAREIKLDVRMGSDVEMVGSDTKHLSRRQLFRRAAELQEELRHHGEVFRNPDGKAVEARQRAIDIDVQRSELRDRLDGEQRKLERELQVKQPQQQAVVDARMGAIGEAQKQRKLLKDQQVALVEQIEDLKKKGQPADAKVKELGEISAKIEKIDQQIENARKEIEAARREIEESKQEAASLNRDVQALRVELKSLDAEREQWAVVHRMARAQKSYRGLKIRIHRRTVLALAVFVFAMIGIPLGIMTRRRSTMVAFGIGFAIVLLLFYPLLIFGQVMAESGLLPIAPAMWSGNVVVFTIGLLLTAAVLRK